MAEGEMVKFLAPLGVGGILALLIFMNYRKDFLQERAVGREREDLLLKMVERSAAAAERLSVTIDNLGDMVKEVRGDREWLKVKLEDISTDVRNVHNRMIRDGHGPAYDPAAR